MTGTNRRVSCAIAGAIAAFLLIEPSGIAAPTCIDQDGDTIKCGAPGAMPLGWRLSPEEELARDMEQTVSPNLGELLELICLLGVFFSLMAMLPDCDGWRDDDGKGRG